MPSDGKNTPVTELLAHLHEGDESVANLLFENLYDELRIVARKNLRDHGARQGFDTVALVNEVYLKLVDPDKIQSKTRGQFFALASKAMRNVLVDWVRHEGRAKRGGGAEHVDVHELTLMGGEQRPTYFVDLESALKRLAEIDKRAATIVECRYFAGLKLEEIAEALAVSVSTVQKEWKYAQAWLRDALGER